MILSFVHFMFYNLVWWIIRLNFKDFGQKSHTALLTFLFVQRSQKSMYVVCVWMCIGLIKDDERA